MLSYGCNITDCLRALDYDVSDKQYCRAELEAPYAGS